MPSKTHIKLFFVSLLVSWWILVGCSAEQKEEARKIQEALGSEPRELSPSCPIVFGEYKFFPNFNWVYVHATVTHITPINLATRLRFGDGTILEFVPKDLSAVSCSVAGIFHKYCIQDVQTLWECVNPQLQTAGYTMPASIPANVPTLVPGLQNPSPTLPVSSTPAPLVLPQLFEFYWQKPNGEMIKFSTESDARYAAENSWEGGSVVMLTKVGDTQIGPPVVLGNPIEGFKPPPGVNITSPQVPYYGTESGKYFATLDEALAYAKSQNFADNIHTFVRGIDYGIAQSVSAFTPVVAKNDAGQNVSVDASQRYIQVTSAAPNGVFQIAYFTEDNLAGAMHWAYQIPYGSDISYYKRGELVQQITSVEPWEPPLELIAAFDGSFSDLSQQYWVYQENLGTMPFFFREKAAALKFAEEYGKDCVFPGGIVSPYIRNFLQEGSETRPSWTCPAGLPLDHQANTPYFSRTDSNGAEVFYPKLDAAIMSDWISWYLGFDKIEIQNWRRGLNIVENTKTNWWAVWQWLAIVLALFIPLLISIIRNWPKGYKYLESSEPKKKTPWPPGVNPDRTILRGFLWLFGKVISFIPVVAVVVAAGGLALLVSSDAKYLVWAVIGSFALIVYVGVYSIIGFAQLIKFKKDITLLRQQRRQSNVEK